MSKETLHNFFREKFKDISRVVISKSRGDISFYYDPKKSNIEEVLSFFNSSNGDFVLELIEREKVKPSPEEEKEIISGSTWFKLNTIGLVSLLFRNSISPALPFIGFGLAIPVFLKGLRSILGGKIDVHILDSSAIFISNVTGNYGSSVLMTWLLSLGDVIQEKTENVAKVEIEKLLNYKDDYAWVIEGDNIVKKKSAS